MSTKRSFLMAAFLLLLIASAGCSHLNRELDDAPRYNRELLYNAPYDLTYLSVIEALNEYPGWILNTTEKPKGIIQIRNEEYGHIYDKDKGFYEIEVKYVDRTHTSVTLDTSVASGPDVGKEILDRIDSYISASLRSRRS